MSVRLITIISEANVSDNHQSAATTDAENADTAGSSGTECGTLSERSVTIGHNSDVPDAERRSVTELCSDWPDHAGISDGSLDFSASSRLYV